MIVALLKEIYREAPYKVKVNGEKSDPFVPTLGLQQGCPLSPWGYNEYISGPLKTIHQRCKEMGIQLFNLQPSPCTHVDFADDIIATIRPRDILNFLAIVQEALLPLNQHLSLDKSEALPMNCDEDALTHLHNIKIVGQIKALGLLFDSTGCSKTNITTRCNSARSKAIMHSGRLKSLGCLHDTMIAKTMLESDVRATLLFGASLWGHHNIQHKDPMHHPMQKPYSTLQRLTLGQPHGTAHWITTMLMGTLPIQHWIIRDFCRFWNNLLDLHGHPLLGPALCQQHHLLINQHHHPIGTNTNHGWSNGTTPSTSSCPTTTTTNALKPYLGLMRKTFCKAYTIPTITYCMIWGITSVPLVRWTVPYFGMCVSIVL
jgi:hypothetical protein